MFIGVVLLCLRIYFELSQNCQLQRSWCGVVDPNDRLTVIEARPLYFWRRNDDTMTFASCPDDVLQIPTYEEESGISLSRLGPSLGNTPLGSKQLHASDSTLTQPASKNHSQIK